MTTQQNSERPVEALSERNPRVVSAVKLHRAPVRRKSGLFLAEGANSVESAFDTGRIEELFYSAKIAGREHQLVAGAAASGVRTTLVSDRAAEMLGETVTPAGLFAVCRSVDVPLHEVLSAAPTLLAVPVEIADPGNAGTLIRVADAVGVNGIVLAGDSVDPHNGKCVRAAAGSLFHVPLARERDTEKVLSSLEQAGITILATAAKGEVDLDDADELLRGPVAWLFGNEAHGLDRAIADRATHRVRIPIHGRAESLNLAAAASICLYASARVQYAAR